MGLFDKLRDLSPGISAVQNASLPSAALGMGSEGPKPSGPAALVWVRSGALCWERPTQLCSALGLISSSLSWHPQAWGLSDSLPTRMSVRFLWAGRGCLAVWRWAGSSFTLAFEASSFQDWGRSLGAGQLGAVPWLQPAVL